MSGKAIVPPPSHIAFNQSSNPTLSIAGMTAGIGNFPNAPTLAGLI